MMSERASLLEANRVAPRAPARSILIAPSVLSPAARIRPVGKLFWFVDRAAAGEQQVPSRAGARAR